ncbi:hypothetical protein BGZ96_008042 [Linnemannia gamsii]|uniref:Uncharacterized protein n=1 Tax=Linnemannia gamsii TaxID=64522 RepID=A0ABQ7K092_9FUNG|nr:hypothetical protein BGZ96_008042 [Linnemannia gamsii]
MAAPNASAAIWKTFIQQPAIVCLETLLFQVQEARESNPSFEVPVIMVYKDRFHLDQREQATAMLGLDFSTTVPDSLSSSSTSLSSSSSSQSDCIAMTVLQYSILTLFAGQPEDTNQRELVIEMLVKNLSPEEINGQVFGDGNNALHLAAFLNMESTLHVLIAYGGSPLLANGRGHSAFDILFEVTPASLTPPSLRAHRASYPCSFKENVAPATTTLTRAASIASSIKRAHPSEEPHLPSTSYSHQHFSSNTTVHPTHENTHHGKNDIEDESDDNISMPVRSSAECEFVSDNDSLVLELDDGPQVFQRTKNGDEDSLDDYLASRDSLGRSLICDNKAFADGYDHDDLDIFDSSNNAHLVEKDAQDMDPNYFHQNGLELQFLQEQLELDEFERQKIHLHEDLTCFLRIRPDGPSLIASGAYLVSILKNRHTWRPQELSIEHVQSFEAYEDYTERLQLQRKPDVSHIDDLRHQATCEKAVRWNSIKQVREYQRHMNCQLEMDGWDGLLVSEPYDEPVDDSFVPTASPYDIVRPVTPVRPRSHALSMNVNNSRLDLSRADVTGRTSSPLPHDTDRPLPDIPQAAKESAISSFFGYCKGTPPPPSSYKARTAVTETACQANDQVKSASSRPFSKRLSATSLLWNSKRPSSPFAKMPFSSSDIQLQLPMMTTSSDGVLSEFTPGQRDATESLPSLATDSSQWMPRMLRSLTSPPNSLSKARIRNSLDSSQSIPKTQTVQELLLQGAPFSIDPDLSHHGKRSTIVDYDTIFPGSILSSPTTTSTTTATPKMFAQLKSALREKFSSPPGSFTHELTSIPRCVSTPPLLPPNHMSQSLSEPSSPNMSTVEYNREWPVFPARESSLDRRSSNSSAISDSSTTDDDAHEDSKVNGSLQQRRPSTPSDLADATIRAHIPRVTSPLARGSSARSTTRSPQLYPLTMRPSESVAEDAEAEKIGDEQADFLTRGPRAASPIPQEFSQSADRRLSLTGVANQLSGIINSSAALTSRMSTTDIREDPNRPALPERPPSRSGSYSPSLPLPWPHQAQDATVALRQHRSPSETSVTKHSNWTKRKEVAALVHPPRTSSLPPGPLPAPALPLRQQQDLPTANKGLRMEEIPTCGTNDHEAESKFVEILDTCIFSETESVLATPVIPVVNLFPLQQKDPRVKHYQDMLVTSTELAARTKPQYVLPELVFSAESSEEMEYIHGVTHDTSSGLFTDIQDNSKGSLMGAALVNIQGISHGLEVQKYNLRQSTVVGRFSDVDLPSSALSLVVPSHQSLYHERYASLWMDLSEFESQPRRSTLSNCDSPSTFQTGNTMVSIRIDTGYEKVDTDYVPLEDFDMFINQEFCLPVCPGLAITITLHLMQAPHLQPRYHQQHLPTAAYSSPPHAICNNNSTAYTPNPHPFILDDHRSLDNSIASTDLEQPNSSDIKSSIDSTTSSFLAALWILIVDVYIDFDI